MKKSQVKAKRKTASKKENTTNDQSKEIFRSVMESIKQYYSEELKSSVSRTLKK